MAKTTIYDIAQEAKCSTATVSLVLNDSDKVNPKTKQRVWKVIHKFGYTPNFIAQSLSNKSLKTLGLIVPNIENPLFSQMILGVENYAVSNSYDLIIGFSDSNFEKENYYLDMLQSKRVDGLLVFPTFLDNLSEKLSSISNKNIPVVLCGSSGKDYLDIDYVKCDNRMGSYIANKHLIDIGCKKIGCIFPVSSAQQYESRLIGYKDALYYHEIPYKDNMIRTCSANNVDIFNATIDLIKNESPDAIFCLYDYAAISVMRAIISLNLQIPNDIAVIGYDNIKISEYLPTSLSTIDTLASEVGRKSAELLIKRIKEPSRKTTKLVLTPKLIVRESTTF